MGRDVAGGGQPPVPVAGNSAVRARASSTKARSSRRRYPCRAKVGGWATIPRAHPDPKRSAPASAHPTGSPAPNSSRDRRTACRSATCGTPTTPTLGAAIVGRDQGALAELYQRNGATALALARRVLGDRVLAEEVVQEVFVRTWRQPERFDPDRGSMRSFLLAQVHGRAVDLLRAESARRARGSSARRSAAPRDDDDLEREVLDLAEAEAVRARAR